FPAYGILYSHMITIFYVVDKDKSARDSLKYFLLFIGLGVFSFICQYGQFAFFARAGETMSFRLKSQIVRNLLRQDIGYFDQPNNRPGVLTSRLSADMEKVRSLFVDRTGSLIC